MSADTPAASRLITLGEITGVHGVRGWVRVRSETQPRENILKYRPWLLDGQSVEVAEGRRQGKGLTVRLKGFEDRDQAATLIGQRIQIRRDQLPPPAADEFYWADLERLRVVTCDGVALGQVQRLFDTGANDVLVVKGDRERLLPFIWDQVIREIDFDAGEIRVDWDPDF